MPIQMQQPAVPARAAFGADAMLLSTVGAVFAVEALAKSTNPASTLAVLQGPLGLSHGSSTVAVVALIGAEFLVASLLIAGLWIRPVILLTTLFLIAASGLIVYLWLSKSTLGCGCGLTFNRGSVLGDRIIPLTRNALLILCLGVGFFLRHPSNTHDQQGVIK